jgi:hypothetical protein
MVLPKAVGKNPLLFETARLPVRKARLRPSGDQRGDESSASSALNRLSVLPARVISQMCERLFFEASMNRSTNATVEPSGDICTSPTLRSL